MTANAHQCPHAQRWKHRQHINVPRTRQTRSVSQDERLPALSPSGQSRFAGQGHVG